MGQLWGEVSVNPDGNEVYIYPGLRRASVPVERADAAITLYRTVLLVARETAREQGEIVTATRPTEGDVGFPWPLVAAAAIVSVGQAVAIGYCAHQAALVIDRQLSRKAELARIVQADRAALDVVRAHQAREEKAGKPLPLDAASKDVLGGLAQRQQEYAKRHETPLDSGLPSLPTFTAGATGFSLGAIAVGALALFLVLKT